MQEQLLYEYAVIRFVPKVEREEFINSGIILYCSKAGFLKAKFHLHADKLKTFCTDFDVKELENYFHTWDKICAGDQDGGPIAKLPVASRFRWLTAIRSTVIQVSKVHPGFCSDPEKTLQHLFEKMVL